MALATLGRGSDRLWRLFGTGLGFAVFGIGGLLLRLVVFPAQRWLAPVEPGRRRLRARATICRAFRVFIGMLTALGVLRCTVTGAERLGRPGQLVLANHPSLLDVVIVLGLPQLRHCGCIVKESLWQNPFTRGPVRTAAYISNDGSMQALDQSVAQLQEGLPLLVFPEGTRTVPGRMPVFHRGACAIALRGARVLTPVRITLTPPSLTKGLPWYRIPERRMEFRIEVGEDINPQDWLAGHPMPIAARRLNAHLHQLYSREDSNQTHDSA